MMILERNLLFEGSMFSFQVLPQDWWNLFRLSPYPSVIPTNGEFAPEKWWQQKKKIRIRLPFGAARLFFEGELLVIGGSSDSPKKEGV